MFTLSEVCDSTNTVNFNKPRKKKTGRPQQMSHKVLRASHLLVQRQLIWILHYYIIIVILIIVTSCCGHDW